MDHIEGIPEGYCAHSLVNYTPVQISPGRLRERWSCVDCGQEFAPRIPIEQPKQLEAELLPGECPHCHCFPAREFHSVNCKTNDYLKPKQLKAVIVVPIRELGYDTEVSIKSMVLRGISQRLAEELKLQHPAYVTIHEREKGAK